MVGDQACCGSRESSTLRTALPLSAAQTSSGASLLGSERKTDPSSPSEKHSGPAHQTHHDGFPTLPPLYPNPGMKGFGTSGQRKMTFLRVLLVAKELAG